MLSGSSGRTSTSRRVGSTSGGRSGGGTFVTPKSRRSRRRIDVAPTLREALRQLPSRFRGELVFCTEHGSALDPDNFAHRDFPRALRRAGLRRVRFHDLRHTYLVLLCYKS